MMFGNLNLKSGDSLDERFAALHKYEPKAVIDMGATSHNGLRVRKQAGLSSFLVRFPGVRQLMEGWPPAAMSDAQDKNRVADDAEKYPVNVGPAAIKQLPDLE
jgi:hypothetical protein